MTSVFTVLNKQRANLPVDVFREHSMFNRESHGSILINCRVNQRFCPRCYLIIAPPASFSLRDRRYHANQSSSFAAISPSVLSIRSIVCHSLAIVHPVCHVTNVCLHQIDLFVAGVRQVHGKKTREIVNTSCARTFVNACCDNVYH